MGEEVMGQFQRLVHEGPLFARTLDDFWRIEGGEAKSGV
jgi:hypothetical protein